MIFIDKKVILLYFQCAYFVINFELEYNPFFFDGVDAADFFFMVCDFIFLKLHINVSSTVITAPSLSNSPQ